MPFGQVPDSSNTLFRQLSHFKLGKSDQTSASASSYIPECPLSPRSVGSFWSDSDSEDDGDGDDEEVRGFEAHLDRRQSRQTSRDSQWTLASSESSSTFGSRRGDGSTRQSSRSSTSTLRSECNGSMKAVFPSQIFDGTQTTASPTEEAMRPLQGPVRPPLKTHSSFPIPSSPVLPDVFLDGSVKATTGAQLAPWALSGATLRPRPSELERRRSWQSPHTKVHARSEQLPESLRPQAAANRNAVGDKDHRESTVPSSSEPPRIAQTTGPSFVSRFQAPSATPRTPVEEQRERIARMAANVVSSFSPYDTPAGPTQEASTTPSSSAGIGLGLNVGRDDSDGISTPSSALRTSPNKTAMWSIGSSPGSIWGSESSLTPSFESLKSSKRTSMPPPPRQEGAVSRTAYNTPLILQTNSPSMRFSPALGATAQSSWSSGPYSASPRPECRSPFIETVEEVATGTPSLRPSSLSPSLTRRGSASSRKGSFCSSPLASQPVTALGREENATDDAFSAPESPSLELAEVHYLLGFVERQLEKLSTPKASTEPQFEGANFAALADQRLSTTSDAAAYDWTQFRNSSIVSSSGDSYSRQGSMSGAAQSDTKTRPLHWPQAAYPLSLNASARPFNPKDSAQGIAGLPRSPSLPSVSSSSPPRATLAPSISDSSLFSRGDSKVLTRPCPQPKIPVIVDTPATPLRDVSANVRPLISELPRRSLPGLSPPKGDDLRASFSSEMGDFATRRKPTKRGTRSGKRVQKARSERALRLEAQKQAEELEPAGA